MVHSYFVLVSSRDYAGLEVLGTMLASKVHMLTAEALVMLIETRSIECAMPTSLCRLKQHTSLDRRGWNGRSIDQSFCLVFSLEPSFLAMVEAVVILIVSRFVEGDSMGDVALYFKTRTLEYCCTTLGLHNIHNNISRQAWIGVANNHVFLKATKKRSKRWGQS